MGLPFLNIMLLPKPPSMDLQNALSIIMIFHVVLLLIEGLISQPNKCDSEPTIMESSEPTIMESTGLTMFAIILRQLAC